MPLPFRRYAHELLTPRHGGRTGRSVDWVIITLILGNVAAVVLETVPALHARYGTFFRGFEILSVAVFTLEYAGRIWTAPENPGYEAPVTGRIRYASRPVLLVDLLAILPFYAAGVVALDLRVLRAFRLIRFLRLLKIARYSRSLRLLVRVVRRKRPDLLIAVAVNAVLLTVASSLMYFVEHDVQPTEFSSIPATMWWGAITLTTVGYGDVVPVTPQGKVLGAVVAVLGIGLFALPASILATGFLEEALRDEPEFEPEFEPERCPHCGEELHR